MEDNLSKLLEQLKVLQSTGIYAEIRKKAAREMAERAEFLRMPLENYPVDAFKQERIKGVLEGLEFDPLQALVTELKEKLSHAE